MLIEKLLDYGLIGLTLLFLGWGIWRSVAWIGPNFLIPIKERIVVHIDNIDSAVKTMLSLIQKLADSIDRQNIVLDKMERRVEATDNATVENTKTLNRIEDDVKKICGSADEMAKDFHEDRNRNQQ